MWMVQQQGGILLWSHCTGLAGSCFVFVFVSAFVFGLDKQHQKWLAWAHPATESVPWLSWKLFLYLYLFLFCFVICIWTGQTARGILLRSQCPGSAGIGRTHRVAHLTAGTNTNINIYTNTMPAHVHIWCITYHVAHFKGGTIVSISCKNCVDRTSQNIVGTSLPC